MMITEKTRIFAGPGQLGACSCHAGSAKAVFLLDMGFLMHNDRMNIRSA
jgi:hypothetical protein